MDFVYPFIPNNKLEQQVINYCESASWKQFTAHNVEQLKKQFPNNIIPVKTKLYHGSMADNIVFDKPQITFFGIDVVISLLILPEQRERMLRTEFENYYSLDEKELEELKNRHPTGYLYEFEVVKNIPFNLLEDLCNQHPSSVEICKTQPCLHPQIAPEDPIHLSTELTMDLKDYKDHIQLKKKYEVDVNLLDKNQKKLFSEFNPVSAIKFEEPPKFNPISILKIQERSKKRSAKRTKSPKKRSTKRAKSPKKRSTKRAKSPKKRSVKRTKSPKKRSAKR